MHPVELFYTPEAERDYVEASVRTIMQVATGHWLHAPVLAVFFLQHMLLLVGVSSRCVCSGVAAWCLLFVSLCRFTCVRSPVTCWSSSLAKMRSRKCVRRSEIELGYVRDCMAAYFNWACRMSYTLVPHCPSVQDMGPDVPELVATPLYSSLPPRQQERIFDAAPGALRRVH